MAHMTSATTEQSGALQYWSREDAEDSATLNALNYVAESMHRSTRGRRQRFLTDAAWEAPQLGKWARRRVMATLLEGRTDSNRDAHCHVTRFVKSADVPIERTKHGTWSTRNLVQCGRMTCPVCGVRRARRVASMIGACIANHRNHEELASDVWMLTLAPPHYAHDDLELYVDRLYEATASFFRTPAWRRFAAEYEITARVRVLDATFGGANGTHPHFHIALFPRSAYVLTSWFPTRAGSIVATGDIARKHREERELYGQDFADAMVKAITAWDERPAVPYGPANVWDFIAPLRTRTREHREAFLAELADGELSEAWRVCCERAGIAVHDRSAFKRNALKLSPSEDAAAYFTRWGLADEVASSPQKHRSHLRLLDVCAAGGPDGDRAGDLYRAWREAVAGHAWVTGLSDAMASLGVHDEDGDAYLEALHEKRARILARVGTPVVEVAPLSLVIKAWLYPAALSVGWEDLFKFCDERAAVAPDAAAVQRELDAMLWRNLASRPPSFAEEPHVLSSS